VRTSDWRIVAAILDEFAELTRGGDGHWTELCGEIVLLAGKVRGSCAESGGQSAQIAVVRGPEHGHYVREARDRAVRRLLVTSHRLGPATRAAVLVPAIAAVQDRGLEVKVYYGRPTGGVRSADASALTSVAAEQGVSIQAVREPRLHAKLLAWDDDFLLVT